MKSNTATTVTTVTALALTALTVLVAGMLGSRSYYIASVLVILYATMPFLISFEGSRPTARELVLLAVLCALATASRIAFAWLPFLKPMGAVVAIAGIALGPRAGFMSGAVSMLASNLVFGQGPWTPWQMFAFGMLGFAAGMLPAIKVVPRKRMRPARLVMVSGGIALFYICVCGPMLDTASLFLFTAAPTVEGALAIYGAGLVPNVLQAIGIGLTFLLVGNPLLGRIDRICAKYGIDR